MLLPQSLHIATAVRVHAPTGRVGSGVDDMSASVSLAVAVTVAVNYFILFLSIIIIVIIVVVLPSLFAFIVLISLYIISFVPLSFHFMAALAN